MPNYDLIGPTNLQTTVDDLMRWDANFDTMTVGGATALTEMQTPGLGDYGLGLFIAQQGGIYVVEHDGRDAGYRSPLIRFPDRKLSIALLCNVALPNVRTPTVRHGRWCVMLPSSILAQHVAPPPPAPVPGATSGSPPSNQGEFTGQFHSDELDVTYTLGLNERLSRSHAKNTLRSLCPPSPSPTRSRRCRRQRRHSATCFPR